MQFSGLLSCLRTQVSSFLDSGDEVATTLRSRAIMKMLVERCEMEKASKSDRALAAQSGSARQPVIFQDHEAT